MTIHLEPDFQALLGLAVALAAGLLISWWMKRLRRFFGDAPPPDNDSRIVEQWTRLTAIKSVGWQVGLVERAIFFAALWLQLPWLIPSWLATKVAFYWGGTNLGAFPEKVTAETIAAQVSKRAYATKHVAIALIGTGANIVAALVGVAAGKWILIGL